MTKRLLVAVSITTALTAVATMENPNVLIVPKQDTLMKEQFSKFSQLEAHDDSARQFFAIWDSLQGHSLLKEEDAGLGMSVFTISDAQFAEMIPEDIPNPFLKDKGLQRLVLATQLVAQNVKPTAFKADEEIRVRTVGGRTLVLKKEKDSLTVNDVPVKKVFENEGSTLYLLEKVLWLRPEDISSAVGNMERDPKYPPI